MLFLFMLSSAPVDLLPNSEKLLKENFVGLPRVRRAFSSTAPTITPALPVTFYVRK